MQVTDRKVLPDHTRIFNPRFMSKCPVPSGFKAPGSEAIPQLSQLFHAEMSFIEDWASLFLDFS